MSRWTSTETPIHQCLSRHCCAKGSRRWPRACLNREGRIETHNRSGRCRHLEQLAEPSPELKANGIVGQANRVLDLRGLYQTLSGSDEPPQPMDGYIFAGMQVPFTDVVDNPMYGMLIQQPRVVRELADWVRGLGAQIRWGHELTDFEQGSDGVVLDVSSPEGNYRLPATYLVGADGGRSPVRKKAGIDFPGLTTDVIARVAHISLPDELRTGYGALNVPGVGQIPFGHNRFEGGVLI
nr:FAD-dependent monooxygenase [Streptomyces sp. DSM 41633]